MVPKLCSEANGNAGDLHFENHDSLTTLKEELQPFYICANRLKTVEPAIVIFLYSVQQAFMEIFSHPRFQRRKTNHFIFKNINEM